MHQELVQVTKVLNQVFIPGVVVQCVRCRGVCEVCREECVTRQHISRYVGRLDGTVENCSNYE